MRHNAVFFFGALAVSVLNYAYYPVLGRLLSLEEYGEVQVLISLFLQLTIFLTVLSQVAINIVANYEDRTRQARVLFELEKLSLFISLALLVIGALASPFFQNVLRFESPWPFIILLVALVATVPLTFRSAYLRGNKKFATVSAGNILGAAGKIVVSALLVVIGLSTPGAIFGIVAAQLLAFAYTAYKAKQAGFIKPESHASYFSLPNSKEIVPELRYSAIVLVASLSIMVLTSVDVLLVKYFFDAETAGGYAGIATVAKVLFFLTASVAQVMLSSVKLAAPAKQNRALLVKSAVLVAGLGGIGLIAFLAFPNFFVSLLMGHRFEAYAYLLPPLATALFVLSILNLVVSYYMALRRYQISLLAAVGVVGTIIVLLQMHSSLSSIVQGLLWGSVGTLVLIALWRLSYRVLRRDHV